MTLTNRMFAVKVLLSTPGGLNIAKAAGTLATAAWLPSPQATFDIEDVASELQGVILTSLFWAWPCATKLKPRTKTTAFLRDKPGAIH